MDPLEVINNADSMIKQMKITIKDAYEGTKDATENALHNWCDSNIHLKSTGGIIIVDQSKKLIPLTCINVSKSDRKNQRRIIANVGQKLDYPRSISIIEEDLQGLVAVPMKKKQAKAFNFVFFQENVKKAKIFNLGEKIKIDGKLHELYV